MSYDLARQRTVMFGGNGPTGLTDQTWEWDGATWTLVTPTQLPPGRYYHAMAYDDESQRIVTFGGQGIGVTWLYGGARDAPVSTLGPGCPGSAGTPRLAANDPFIGNPAFAIDLVDAPPAAPALFGLSTSAQTVSLGGGCSLYLQSPALQFALANASGFA